MFFTRKFNKILLFSWTYQGIGSKRMQLCPFKSIWKDQHLCENHPPVSRLRPAYCSSNITNITGITSIRVIIYQHEKHHGIMALARLVMIECPDRSFCKAQHPRFWGHSHHSFLNPLISYLVSLQKQFFPLAAPAFCKYISLWPPSQKLQANRAVLSTGVPKSLQALDLWPLAKSHGISRLGGNYIEHSIDVKCLNCWKVLRGGQTKALTNKVFLSISPFGSNSSDWGHVICPCGRNHLPLCPHCLWLMLLLSGCLWCWNCLARQRDCSKQTQLLLSGGAKNITMLSSEINNTHTHTYIYICANNKLHCCTLVKSHGFPRLG